MFTYNLILYTEAILSSNVSKSLWDIRGFIVAMCVPLVGIAVGRSPIWFGGIIVSRQIAIYSVTLIAAAIYIVIVGFLGYYIRIYGGDWGTAAGLIFMAALVLSLSLLLVSDHARAGLKVFVTKHFYKNEYDYRNERMRLIDTLTRSDGSLSLQKRSVKSLAQVIDAPAGQLWLTSQDRSEYRCVAGWNSKCSAGVMRKNHSLARFLIDKQWIVDLHPPDDNHKSYRPHADDDRIEEWPDSSLVIPLLHNEELLGFVTVSSPPVWQTLNFEDYDLLRTAGKHIASYLAQEPATEQLAESKQFEAFSKLTAYLMHDLKNVVAQQLLVVENAKKHKDQPEFIDDAIDAIRRGVIRLRRIIEQLQQNSQVYPPARIEIGKLLLQVVSQCSDRQPVPRSSLDDKQIRVKGERDRLMMAIYNVVRNAQDATMVDGDINISVESEESKCIVVVDDSGAGMEDDFIRGRYFRLFDSTKGTQGMGIGAYQMWETLRSTGGDVLVLSEPARGTSIRMFLPQIGINHVA